MLNAVRSPRRVILLGLVISLGLLVLPWPRPTSEAQEPAKATDKRGLREQIGTLHAELDLMEVEQGVDRQSIPELIREERSLLAEIDAYILKRLDLAARKINAISMSGSPEEAWDQRWDSWGGGLLLVIPSIDESTLEEIAKRDSNDPAKFEKEIVEEMGSKYSRELLAQVVGLFKIKDWDAFQKARDPLLKTIKESVTNKATEAVRTRSTILKKEFARRSAEIALKKLDLEELERRYRQEK